MKARVSELFFSISGEGISAGVPTVFIRFSGCSLRCGQVKEKKLWCDTGYSLSFESGNLLTIDEIINEIENYSQIPTQILLTGGEPLEGKRKEFCQILCKEISAKRFNKEFAYPRIETNGAIGIRNLKDMVFTLDYKLPGSGMEERMIDDNFLFIKERNNPLDEVKFVIRDRNDFERSLSIIEKFQLTQNLLYSPVSNECNSNELVDWIKKDYKEGMRLSLQIHKMIWGDKRGV